MQPINLQEKFSKFADHWHPRVIGTVNDCEIKLAKIAGEFDWHHHEEEDEFFLVVKGGMRIDFRDDAVVLGEGECFVVPRGVEHRPVAENECWILLFEPAGTLNTGNAVSDRTVQHPERI